MFTRNYMFSEQDMSTMRAIHSELTGSKDEDAFASWYGSNRNELGYLFKETRRRIAIEYEKRDELVKKLFGQINNNKGI